jgi:hypothetical protein
MAATDASSTKKSFENLAFSPLFHNVFYISTLYDCG